MKQIYLWKAFGTGLFLDLPQVCTLKRTELSKSSTLTLSFLFGNDGTVNLNDFWSRKKAYVNQRRLSVKSDFFWIKSSAKRAFGGCLGSKRR